MAGNRVALTGLMLPTNRGEVARIRPALVDGRTDIVEGRVPALPVVEDLDVFKQSSSQCRRRRLAHDKSILTKPELLAVTPGDDRSHC